jgi:hypothetical protein
MMLNLLKKINPEELHKIKGKAKWNPLPIWIRIKPKFYYKKEC